VREGREKILCASKGQFLPHLPDKSLILLKSRTISSESRLFNGLRGLKRGNVFLALFPSVANATMGTGGLWIEAQDCSWDKPRLDSDFLQEIAV